MSTPILPEPLMGKQHTAAFDPILRNYLANDSDLTGQDPPEVLIDTNPDTCAEGLLPYLAEKWGVEGWKGYDLCTTTDQKRALIRTAATKNLKHGTNAALKQALEDAGYRNVVINDHMNYVKFLDGTWRLDGTTRLMKPGESWADFTVSVSPPDGVDQSDVDRAALTKFINYWKRGSSRLVALFVGTDVVMINNLAACNDPNAMVGASSTQIYNPNNIAGDLYFVDITSGSIQPIGSNPPTIFVPEVAPLADVVAGHEYQYAYVDGALNYTYSNILIAQRKLDILNGVDNSGELVLTCDLDTITPGDIVARYLDSDGNVIATGNRIAFSPVTDLGSDHHTGLPYTAGAFVQLAIVNGSHSVPLRAACFCISVP